MLGECARLATLAADEKASLLAGFFCRGPALGETYSVARRSCCGLVGILGARFRTPKSSGWLAGSELVDDYKPITLCPPSAGLFLRTLPAPPGLRAGARSTGRARHPAQRLPLHLPTLFIIVTERDHPTVNMLLG